MSGTKKEFAELSDEEHMGKVKAVLEELNKYADDTIYSFKDMTASIGKFTNAGVKLDTAAKSMMGISNLAAVAGQGTQQASMAMYNFSQAMGMGYVELRDWRSIENANMATAEFKQTLIDVGISLGTLKQDSKGVVKTAVKGQKKVAVTAETLRETLNKKWLTDDVLQKTLEIYSGDLGEKEIRALGNFTDEQVTAFLKIGAEAKKAATQVRTFSKMYDALKEAAQSGWAMSFEKIIGDVNEATDLWTKINLRISGWMEDSAKKRNAILNRWRGMSDDGTLHIDEIDGRQEMIDALNNIFDIVEKIGGAISGAVESVFGTITGDELRNWSADFNTMTANVSKWLGDLKDSDSNISKISKALRLVLVPIKLLGKTIAAAGKVISTVVMPFFEPILNFLAVLGELISNLFDGKIDVKAAVNGIKSAFKSLSNSFKTIGKQVWSNVAGWFSKLFHSDNGELTSIGLWFKNIYDKFNEYLGKLKEFIHWDEIKKWASGVWEEILGFFRGEQTGVDFATGKAVYGESGFSKLFAGLSEDFNTALDNFKKLIGWDELSKKLGEITAKVKEWLFGGDEEVVGVNASYKKKSGFHKFFSGLGEGFNTAFETFKKIIGWDTLSEKLGEITAKVKEWLFGDGEEVVGVNASYKKKSGLSKMLADMISTISGFKETIGSWSGWKALGDFFTNNVINPVIDFVTPQGDGQPSKLKEKFGEYKAAIQGFIIRIGNWKGWSVLGKFFNEKILQPIISFVTPQGDGQPSKLKEKFSEYRAAIQSFIIRIGNWKGWSALGKFFTERIKQPIIDFVTSTNGEPSKLSKLFEDIKTNVSTFFSNVRGWTGWESLGTFFTDYIITPITRLWNFLVHGDADYDEKKVKKAFNPIGAIASANASDISFGRKQNQETKTFFGEMKENLEQGVSDLASVGSDLVAEGAEQTPLQKVIGWFDSFTKAINDFKDSVQKAVDWLVNEPWEDHFKTLNDKLRQLGITFGILNTGNLIGGLGRAAYGVGQAFSGVGKTMGGGNPLVNMFTNVKDKASTFIMSLFGKGSAKDKIATAVGGVKEGMVTSTDRIKSLADMIIELAIAVGGMAIAINTLIDKVKEIENIEDTEKVQKIWAKVEWLMTGIMSSVLVTELIGMASSIFGQAKVNSVGMALIGFAAAIEGMVLAIGQLVGVVGKTNETELNSALSLMHSLLDIISVFTLFTEVSSLLGNSSGKSNKTGLIGFAVALEGLVLELKQLIGVVSETDKTKIDGAVDILWELADVIDRFVLIKNFSSIQIGGLQTGGGKTGLVGFAIAIEAMLHALRGIIEASSKEGVDMATVNSTITQISALITAFEFFKNVSSIKIGEFKMGTGSKSGLVGFALAIEAMVDAVRKLSDLGKAKLVAGQQALDHLASFIFKFQALNLGTELLGSTFASEGKFSYKGGKGTGLIGFVAAITAMLAEVVVIGALPSDQVQNGLSVIQSLTDMINKFQGLTALENFTDKFSSTGQKVAATVSLGLFMAGLAGILWAIAELSKTSDPDKVGKFTEVLSTLWPNIAVIGTYIAAMSALPNGNGWLGGAKAALNIIEFIGILLLAAYGVGKAVKAAEESGSDFFEILKSGVTNITGLISSVFGKAKGEHESAEITAMVEGLNTASTEAEKLDLSNLGKLSEAIKMVKTMSENLPTDPTLLEKWFQGKMSLGDFANNVAGLGEGLKRFNDSLGAGYSASATAQAKIAIGSLISLIDLYKKSNSDIADLFLLEEWLKQFTAKDVNGNSIASYIAEIITPILSSITIDNANIPPLDASGIIESLAVSIESETSQSRLRTAILKAVTGAVDGMKDTGKTALEYGASAAGEALNNASKKFEESTPELGKNVENTVNQLVGYLIPGLTEGAAESMDETAKATYDSGSNVPKGAAGAINDYAYLPINAAETMGLNMLAGFNRGLAIQSPSKAFYNSAQFIVQGAANGLANHQSVIDEVVKMGDDMMLAWQMALTPIEAFIQSKMNLSPRIAPVIDLTAARAGMNAFAGTRYGMNAMVPSLARNVQMPNVQAGQNGSQIVAAINDRIDQLNANIANLKLYLDTGAFVGATVGAYDRALGFRASRSARG